MKRPAGWLAGFLSLILVAPAIGILATQASARAIDAGCVVKITKFAFHPQHVFEGQQATLRLRAKNCTDRRQVVRVTQNGTLPPPCPVLDPYTIPASLPPLGTYSPPSAAVTAPPCAGVEVLTVTFTSLEGTLLATKTASLIIT